MMKLIATAMITCREHDCGSYNAIKMLALPTAGFFSAWSR